MFRFLYAQAFIDRFGDRFGVCTIIAKGIQGDRLRRNRIGIAAHHVGLVGFDTPDDGGNRGLTDEADEEGVGDADDVTGDGDAR